MATHPDHNVEQIQTRNNMGFDMGVSSYRAEAWWQAYDPSHPEVLLLRQICGSAGHTGTPYPAPLPVLFPPTTITTTHFHFLHSFPWPTLAVAWVPM